MHGFPHRLMVLDAATVMTADKGCYMQKVELTDFVYLGQPNDTVTPESLALMLAFTYFEGRSPTLSKAVARIIRDSGLRVDSGLLPLEVNIRKGEDTELPWVLSLRAWRQSTLGLVKEDKPLEPTFVDNRKFLMIVLVFVAVVVLDYVLVTLLINHDGWCDDMLIKILGGTMIASSLLANILMIRQRNDAWIHWVIYSAAGIAFYVVVGNLFSILLFVVFLIINARAQIAWIRMTKPSNYGWARQDS